MSYDPNEIKEWVVGSSGFWFKGDVNTGRWVVPFIGTWKQVCELSDAMADMERRHYNERKSLEEKQHQELKTFFPDA